MDEVGRIGTYMAWRNATTDICIDHILGARKLLNDHSILGLPKRLDDYTIRYVNFMLLGLARSGDVEPRRMLLDVEPSQDEINTFNKFFNVESAFSVKGIGFEIEQPPEAYRLCGASFWRLLGGHHEYYGQYEISIPPLNIDYKGKNLRIFKKVMRNLEYFVSEIEEYNPDDDEAKFRGCGSHVHISINGTVRSWAKLMNTLISLTPIFAPFFSWHYYLGKDGIEKKVSNENFFNFREELTHWCKMVDYVTIDDVERIVKESKYLRKSKPNENDNSYSIIQINKYRKAIITIELRLNEAPPPLAWLAVYLMVKYSMLIDKSPMIIDIDDLYNEQIFSNTCPPRGMPINDELNFHVIRSDKLVFNSAKIKAKRFNIIGKIYEIVKRVYGMPKPLEEILLHVLREGKLPNFRMIREII